MEEKNAREKLDEAKAPLDVEGLRRAAAGGGSPDAEGAGVAPHGEAPVAPDEPSHQPESTPDAEGLKAARDRTSHRTLVICAVAFAVLLVGAGAAYSVLAPAAEKADLVAEPAYKDAAGKAPSSSLPGEEDTTGRDAQGSGKGAASQPVTAPDFTAVDAEGREVTLADFRGKPVVLNFWASWCGPCQSEMPAFQAAFQRYGDDVQFLMVNMTGMNGETRETATRLVTSEHYTFPVFFDQNSSAARAYGVNSIPQTWFIAADGTVTARAMGALSEAKLEQGIELIAS